jgi:hypothetical protein
VDKIVDKQAGPCGKAVFSTAEKTIHRFFHRVIHRQIRRAVDK